MGNEQPEDLLAGWANHLPSTVESPTGREVLMSVLMTLRVAGDPKKLEEFAANGDTPIPTLRDRAVDKGCLSHHFYGTDDEIMVVDEWRDEASFRAFFDGSPEIKDVMGSAGVTAQPEIQIWRKLETGDDV
jgi:quinol monooxygenase YgiN